MRFIHVTGLAINLFAAHAALAIEQEAALRQESTGTGWNLITIACSSITLVALVALVYYLRRVLLREANRSKNDPKKLLHELCRVHGLSRRAERLLRKAATAVGTPHPGRFFLEPDLLRQAAECSALKKSRRALSLLWERLFGDDTA